MTTVQTTQGHSTVVDGWGLKSNKHLFDHIVNQERDWELRESVFRESNRAMKNNIVEQRKAIRDIEDATDFYDRMNTNRERMSSIYGAMKSDVSRGEELQFQLINNR